MNQKIKLAIISIILFLTTNTVFSYSILTNITVDIDGRSSTSDIVGLVDENNTPLSGHWSTPVTSDMVQIIKAGNDQSFNLPNMLTGETTGDDLLLKTVYIGTGYHNPTPDLGLFYTNVTSDINAGDRIYVRAWNDNSVNSATHYGDSQLYTVQSGINEFWSGGFATTKDKDIIAPAPNPILEANSGQLSVYLSWLNSPSADATGTLVVRSTDPITWRPDNYRTYSDYNYPGDFYDYQDRVITPGIVRVYTGSNSSKQDTGLLAGQTYYYAAFAYDGAYNYATSAAEGSAVPSESASLIGLVPFIYFQGTAGDSKVELSWAVSANQSINYSTVEIWGVSSNVSTTSNYATVPSSASAVLVASSSFADGNFVHTDLLNYNYYYYSIFGKTAAGVYSQPSKVLAQPKPGSSYDAYNYPNPFSPASGESTTMVFYLDEDGDCDLYLFNLIGEIIWEKSVAGVRGVNSLVWNGKNDWGNYAPNGVYLLRVVKDNKVISTGKVSVLD